MCPTKRLSPPQGSGLFLLPPSGSHSQPQCGITTHTCTLQEGLQPTLFQQVPLGVGRHHGQRARKGALQGQQWARALQMGAFVPSRPHPRGNHDTFHCQCSIGLPLRPPHGNHETLTLRTVIVQVQGTLKATSFQEPMATYPAIRGKEPVKGHLRGSNEHVGLRGGLARAGVV